MTQDNSAHALSTVLADPKSAFGHPDEVVNSARYDQDDKLAILTQWRQDALALQRADGEAMQNGEEAMLQAVDQAMTKLRSAGR